MMHYCPVCKEWWEPEPIARPEIVWLVSCQTPDTILDEIKRSGFIPVFTHGMCVKHRHKKP